VTIKINYIKMKYSVDDRGFYGDFGGAYIPEMMQWNIKELENNYLNILNSQDFREEFDILLRDYAGRPSPLFYASRLSEFYKTNIYLKREDLDFTGAHKINNTIGQILIAKRLGKSRIIAETGAGQHGVATATVCALMGLKCVIYMGKLDVERQTPNVLRMKMLGADVITVTSGNMTLKDATNEAIRDWINNPTNTHYIIGSVVGPHPYPDLVTRLQSVISKELKSQLIEHTGNSAPDYLIACVGGGSNAAGSFYHFLDNEDVKLIAVEASGKGIESGESAATIAIGSPGIIHGSKTILMQNDDGQIIEPYSISAGLDYPGIGPLFAWLNKSHRVTFEYATDNEALEAAFLLTRLEGIIPALEPAHALAIIGRLRFSPEDVVVITLSGRGDKDMAAYMEYMEKINN
jgi:tryptophan synthase beta chain